MRKEHSIIRLYFCCEKSFNYPKRLLTNGSIFSAFGATREEALSELHIAAEAYFEALVAAGKPLPLPEKVTPHSGQLRLRMPKRLHAALSHEAEGENISLNTYIVSLLSERHIEKKLLNRIEALENLIETKNSEKISKFAIKSQEAYKVEENEMKYRSKKQKNSGMRKNYWEKHPCIGMIKAHILINREGKTG